MYDFWNITKLLGRIIRRRECQSKIEVPAAAVVGADDSVRPFLSIFHRTSLVFVGADALIGPAGDQWSPLRILSQFRQ